SSALAWLRRRAAPTSRMRERAPARVGRSTANRYSARYLGRALKSPLETFLCTGGERRRSMADPRLIAPVKFGKKVRRLNPSDWRIPISFRTPLALLIVSLGA